MRSPLMQPRRGDSAWTEAAIKSLSLRNLDATIVSAKNWNIICKTYSDEKPNFPTLKEAYKLEYICQYELEIIIRLENERERIKY